MKVYFALHTMKCWCETTSHITIREHKEQKAGKMVKNFNFN